LAKNKPDQEEFSVFPNKESKDWLESTDDIISGDSMDTSNGKPFIDALGKVHSESPGSVNERRENLTGDDGSLNVLGMPLRYNGVADPNKRVFNKTFENDLPLVFLLPGMPRIQKRAFGAKGEGGLFNFGDGLNNVLNAVSAATNPLSSANTKDGRLVSLEPNMPQYINTLKTMCSQVYAAMGIPGTFVLEDYLSDGGFGSYGMTFFGNKGTSISESAMNEYTASTVASEVNSKNQEIREQRMIAQTGGAGFIAESLESIKQFIDNTVESIPILGGMIGNMIEHLNGQKLYYPDLWSNSLYDRMYNIEFKFHSPYGDRESIFRHVYFPFICLLSMTLPLQDGVFSYKQPFMVKANCPGRFEIEAGYIQSMNVVRGEEQTWTADGFPREITVTLNVRDLYPTLFSSETHTRLKYNKSMINYLESLGGIRYDQLSLINKASMDVKASIGSGSRLVPEYHANKFRNMKYSINNARNIFG